MEALHAFRCKKKEDLLPWRQQFFLGNVDDIDDLEAQSIARAEAFKQTPEGRGRLRLEELLRARRWKSAAEHDEIERLLKLYPEPWQHPDWPFTSNSRSPRNTPDQRKADAERDQRIAKRWREERENKK